MNKKKQQILTTGKDLFWKYGIKRVTVEEICNRSGVSKMTFYKHFSNKYDLAMDIMDSIYDENINRYREIMSSDREYKDKVADLYKIKLDATNDMSHEFLNDYINSGETELISYLNGKIEKIMGIIINDFIIAQEKGEIRKDIKPEFINFFLDHMVKMSGYPELIKLYSNAQEMILELLNFFFYGILPRSEIINLNKQKFKNDV
ncbi:MAG TPA: TetR/AcrR family transcriptional regulator [Bacteroidales bacterium]|nr:TetR/AcrR family transcriptional regulator [Bacteroidales bacterium]